MSKKQKRNISKSRKTGLPQGSLVYIGEHSNQKPIIEIFSYDKQDCININVENAEQAISYISDQKITWINVNGLTEIDTIEKLGKFAKVHNLFIEDILNTQHRPKIEFTEHMTLIIVKMLYLTEDEQVRTEHLVLVLYQNNIFTFQEADGDVFGQLRKRLLHGEGTSIRQKPIDYLLFSLLDTVIDNYYIVIEKMSERIELLEDILIFNPKQGLVSQIQDLKKEIIAIRKAVLPVREIISRLERISHKNLTEDIKTYISDLQDHILQITETIDIYREMTWGLMDMYMSSMSNKMNNIMKTLTIISVIFIPLTFIVGVYGMNFDFMPELRYKLGYPIVWSVMILITIGMLVYFRFKKWW